MMNNKFYANVILGLSILWMVFHNGSSYANILAAKGPLRCQQAITINSLSAVRNRDRTVAVNWVNENESGIVRYELERSADGTKFSTVEDIQYVTNDGKRNEYAILDWNGLETAAYYRIKVVGINGKPVYSATVRVELYKNASPITVFPNPVTGKTINVHFGNQPEGKYSLVLYNIMGQLVWQTVAEIQNSIEARSFSLGALPSGCYRLVTIVDGETRNVQQVIVN